MTSTFRLKNFRRICVAAILLLACAFATATVFAILWPNAAIAKNNGNGNGGGNGGGNGNGNGNAGGNGGGNGNGNSGGNGSGNGNGNAGGNGNGNSGGNGSNTNASGGDNPGAGPSNASDAAPPGTEIVDPDSALNLREAGQIKPLRDVFVAAEQQLGGKVIDAKLVVGEQQALAYDLRVVTQDGHVRRARYDAATLALLSLDDQPVE